MDHVVTLDSRQAAALQATADRFVAVHKGDLMKALKSCSMGTCRNDLTRSLRHAARHARRKLNGHDVL